MKKFLLNLFFVCLSVITAAQTFSSPESVEYDAINNRYIVSNTSSGQLLSVVPGSAPTVFTNNVTAPYGLVIVDSTVYVADNGDVLGFNLVTGVQAFTSNINGGFLNGICADTSGHLFVTDFSTKKIYKIDRVTGNFNLFVSNTVKTPNGILYDVFHNRLVYATWGSNAQIKSVTLADSSQAVLKTTTLTNIDGIVQDGQGQYYIAVWGTQSIYRLDSAFVNNPVQVITSLSSPADIYYNLGNDTIAVPNTGNNTVQFYYVGNLTSVAEHIMDKTNTFLNVEFLENLIKMSWRLNGNDDTQLSLTSIKGDLISKVTLKETNEYLFNPRLLSKGIYFVTVKNSQTSITEKVLIK